MKKTLKKVFAALLALALVVSVAGCGKQEMGLDADGNYEVVWYNGETPQPDTDLVIQELNKYTKEKIGVTVKYHAFARAEYAEKMQLLFAAGEKIDLCYTSSGMKFESNARADAYLDITEILDTVGKPTKKLIPPYALDVFSVGDRQFGIPVLKDWGVQYCVLAFKAKLEAAGMYEKAVNSTSVYDWTEIQRAVKAVYPDDYGILQRGNHSMFNKLPHESISGSVIGGFLTEDYSKVVNIYATDVAAKFFNEMRLWYNEGFIKSDAATSTSDADIRQRGNFLATHGEWLPYMDSTTLSEDDPGYRVWCYGIGTPVLRSAGIATNGMAISATSVNPEKTMEFVNLLYTDAYARNLVGLGIEGKHWVADGDKKYKLPEGCEDKASTGYASQETSTGNRFLMRASPSQGADVMEKYQEFNESCVKSEALGFTFDPAPVAAEIAAIQNVYNEYIPGLLVGSTDPAVKLPEALDKLNKVGAEKVIAEIQRQYDEWRAEKDY